MTIITTPSGRRALKQDGTLYQEFAPSAELQDARFQKQPWRQNTTPDPQTGDIKVNPVQMVTTPKPMFFENQEGAFVTVKGGDIIARDIDGKLIAIETENTRGHLFLNTKPEDDRSAIMAAGEKAVQRALAVKSKAQDKAPDHPFIIEQDKQGRTIITSTMPSGREKTWKTFSGPDYAEKFLKDEKKVADLKKQHDKSARADKGVSDMAHAMALNRKQDAERSTTLD